MKRKLGVDIEYELLVALLIFLGCIALVIIVWYATGNKPTWIERRNALIQECVSLEQYTVDQCIQIVNGTTK